VFVLPIYPRDVCPGRLKVFSLLEKVVIFIDGLWGGLRGEDFV